MTNKTYELWLKDVQAALNSINMPFDDWQHMWRFDFENEFNAGVKADDAAMKANRYWWQEQNKSLKRDCRESEECWLPRGHQGPCQPVSKPTYECGDYVKVEFPDEATGIGEWMWVRVHHCDEEKKLVFGTLDNEPVNDYNGTVELGSELAVSYDNIREHKKASDSRSN
ncbi:MAG TPA: hypothetical protein VK763_03905 [Terriglobales bacterium]|jgi:hypothetical protein|nr:hypothetical protein [Terriglobales bacterium]